MEKGDEIIIYGPQITIPATNESLGIKLHKALNDKDEVPIFVDAFSGETLSNKTLLRDSCYLGQCLRNFGLTKNDVIAVCSENHVRLFDPVVAGLYSGIIVSMFSPLYTERELIHVANISQPSIIFCSTEASSVILKVKDRLKRVPKLVVINAKEDYRGCQSMKSFISEYIPANFDVSTFSPCPVNVKEDVAFILQSSGTTGLPKGVMLTHFNYTTVIGVIGFAAITNPRAAVTLINLPLHHAYGLFLAFRGIFDGGKAIIMKKFDPDVYLKTIQDYKIDQLSIVPSMANFLIKSPLVDKYDLSSVKRIRCGAAPLGKSAEEALIKRLKVDDIRQGYGMTEATIGILVSLDDQVVPGSCGIPFPNMAIKIVDVDTGKSLGPMAVGEIWCRGDIIMKGYFNDPEATRNTIDEDGWLHTGDMAYYDNNHMFFIVDRLKELIKCKGYQVAPAELEAILVNHPKVADVGVIGIPHDRHGEVPIAFVVAMQGQDLTEKELKDFIHGQVAAYKRLESVLFVPNIPRNPAGKIIRRILRDTLHKHNSKL
ncbi:4-coumarate--CoA ligase 1-like [Photinus pyralis]|nr:4-coumarate--CoA ligase 1-like [Photinus pyralis]